MLIIEPSQEANGDNLGMSFRSSVICDIYFLDKLRQYSDISLHICFCFNYRKKFLGAQKRVQFELPTVNEPSVFESLKVSCITKIPFAQAGI